MSEQRGQRFGSGPAYPSAHPQFDDMPQDPLHRRRRAAEQEQEQPEQETAQAPEATPEVPDMPVDETGPRRVEFHRSSTGPIPVGGRRDVGICFVGSTQVTGFGDPKGLGWTGRVVARTQHPDMDLTAYNLGVRGESSADVLNRWRDETERRWADRPEKRLVLSVGHHDVESGLSMARSRLNLANMLDEATNSGIAAFVVGLTPTLDNEMNERIAALAEAQADVCARRGVTYVDCFRPLVGHDQWMSDLASSSDQAHPLQAGYGLIAWLVLHNGWNSWMQLD